MPELQSEYDLGNEFQANESKNYIFNEWLNEVPDDLKTGNELHPYLKERVRQYMITKYQFDPFEGETDLIAPPSPEELADWWQ